jgi:hypothetical protein
MIISIGLGIRTNRTFRFVQDGTVSVKNVQFIDHVVGVKEITLKFDDLTCYQRIEVSRRCNQISLATVSWFVIS